MDCVAVKERFTESNAHDLISKHDVVVDCCDNIATRYVINDECIRQGKVFVSAATQRFSGQVTVYGHRNGPCFRCMYPTTPVTPDSERYGSKLPILSPLPGVVGSIEAVEVLKRDERGLSGIVVAVLLILVAVLAVVMLWGLLKDYITDIWEKITGQSSGLS